MKRAVGIGRQQGRQALGSLNDPKQWRGERLAGRRSREAGDRKQAEQLAALAGQQAARDQRRRDVVTNELPIAEPEPFLQRVDDLQPRQAPRTSFVFGERGPDRCRIRRERAPVACREA